MRDDPFKRISPLFSLLAKLALSNEEERYRDPGACNERFHPTGRIPDTKQLTSQNPVTKLPLCLYYCLLLLKESDESTRRSRGK
jgi:hypothetical protein